MTEKIPLASIGRIAGALYLGTIVAGLFAETGARGSLIVGNDAAAMAAAILGNQPLFRAGSRSRRRPSA